MIDPIAKYLGLWGVGKLTTVIVITIIGIIVITITATLYISSKNSDLHTAVVAAKENPRADSLILCKMVHMELKQDSILLLVHSVKSAQKLFQELNKTKFDRLTENNKELKRSFSDLDQTVKSSINNFYPLLYEKKNGNWSDTIPLLSMIPLFGDQENLKP